MLPTAWVNLSAACTLLVIAISLSTGRTTILQGMVLLVLFAVYLFTIIVP